MKLLEEEIINLKKKLEKDFIDPIEKDILKHFILNGSKFIRSSLSILYLKSQNIEITEDIYKILVAGELIHSASLLHDDVIDNAETRRGKSTIAKTFGSKVSILAGDYLLTSAISNLLKLKDFEIIERFKTCTQKMVEAELKQFFLRDNLPCEKDYLGICKGKTAGLFSCILQSCAQISNIDLVKANSFGELFGLSFQIKNDLESKSAEIDKHNGIYTAKDILGIENTHNLLDNYKQEMKNLIKDFPENIYKESLEVLIKSL